MAKYVNSDGLTYYNNKIKSLLAGKASTGHTHDISTMINTLSVGTSTPVDADYYVSQYVGGGATTTSYYRRPMSTLYNYIKGKTDALYAAKSHTHTSLVDSTDASSTCSMSYLASAKKYNEYNWVAVWDGKTIKSASKADFASSGHNHNIQDLNNYASRIWDATTTRPANAVLIGPNGSNGVANFRKLVAADLPSHTHNYAGSSSAGGSANSVANSLSIQLNGGTATTFNGSAAKSINVTASSIGAAASSHTHTRLELMGTNSITTTTQDTQANWAKVGNSVHFFTKNGEIIDQKSQYGFLLNITSGIDIHQVWMTQTTGNLYHRGANADGWNGSWRKIIDDANVVATKYAVGSINDFDTDWGKVASLNMLAYWNGRFNSKDSSLSYCRLGAFGSGAIRNITYGTTAPSGTANNGDIYIQYS